MSENNEKYFVGVDVGTGSTRGALVNSYGQVIRTHVRKITTWNPLPDHYEQSSDDVWEAVCECVKIVSNGFSDHISGIGFDATCSLVAIDKFGKSLSVSTTGHSKQNIILWMDHRAEKEATEINGTKHELLRFVGGQVSLEMEIPKLLWLKRNLLESCWMKAGRFFDLPDFLTWKCTGIDSRSLCSVVCKWNFDAINNEWSRDYFDKIGLSEIYEDECQLIGKIIQEPGSPVGNGLTELAAKELGLKPNIAVGTSMIDAHAGALGLFGVSGDGIDNSLTSKMGIICGTSSCHMSVVEAPIWTPGVWGPYKSVIFPKMFLHEAGQSTTGILLDHAVQNHPAYQSALRNSGELHIYEHLYNVLKDVANRKQLVSIHELTKDLHVWPDFHGNRSPLADPSLKGMICGLTMANDEENLAILYLAFIQGLAYGTRHILETLQLHGRPVFSSLLLCGGLSKNALYVQTHADACNLPVLIPLEGEMVLVGAAMLGACAANCYKDLKSASKAMGGKANVVHANLNCVKYHDKKYKIFLKMLENQRFYKAVMMGEN